MLDIVMLALHSTVYTYVCISNITGMVPKVGNYV